MEIAFTKKIFVGNLLVIVALSLILSFVLHDIIPHEHPSEVYGTGIQAIFHSSDKKYWYLLFLAFIWIASDWAKGHRLDLRTQKEFASVSHFHIDVGKIFNPILEALRTGILNPKLYN